MHEQDTRQSPPVHAAPVDVAAPAVTPAVGVTRVGVLRPLAIRDFRLLWMGLFVSLLGDGIYLVAIAWQVYELSNTPTALSIVSLAWSIPLVLFLLAGGVVSDRFDRRRVMVAADVVRGSAVGTIGVLSLNGRIELWHIVCLAALYGAGQAFFSPAFGAIVPQLVPRELLVQANSLDSSARPLAQRLLGPAIGGLVIGGVGVGWAFLVDAASFAVSATAVLALRTRPKSLGRSEEGSALNDIIEGVRFVRSQTWLWATLVWASFALLFVLGPFQVLVPFVIKNRMHGDAQDIGLVFAAGGAGAILAAVVMGQRGLPRRHILFMYFAWAVGASMAFPYAVITKSWQAMVVEFLAWASFGAGLIVWQTLIHRLVPAHLLGRVTSLDWLVSIGLTPVSYALTGPISEAVGVETTFIWSGILAGGTTLGFLLVPGIRAPEASEPHASSEESRHAGHAVDRHQHPPVV